jgi:hypothetical protein
MIMKSNFSRAFAFISMATLLLNRAIPLYTITPRGLQKQRTAKSNVIPESCKNTVTYHESLAGVSLYRILKTPPSKLEEVI